MIQLVDPSQERSTVDPVVKVEHLPQHSQSCSYFDSTAKIVKLRANPWKTLPENISLTPRVFAPYNHLWVMSGLGTLIEEDLFRDG